MKNTVIFAADNRELFIALKAAEQYEFRNIPYLDSILEVVRQNVAKVVVFDPTLVSQNNSTDPKAMLYNVAMLPDEPQIIFLAGNLEKKDELIHFAISCGIHDIVFNPVSEPKADITEEMRKEIMDRIEHPRKLRDLYIELGITNPKSIPEVSLDTIQEIEKDQVGRPVHSDAFSYFEEEKSPKEPVKLQSPYVVAVLSPASSGASFIAQNVACAMAMQDFEVALIDFDSKRTLHYWFGRDMSNDSFTFLFENNEAEGEETSVSGLHAYTSKEHDSFIGDLGWMNTVVTLPYEVIVLDFSSGRSWRRDLLLKALEMCDEILFIGDMDYAKTQQSRGMLEKLSTKPIRYVLNKWMPDQLCCELSDLAPTPPVYEVPFFGDAVSAPVKGIPLVKMRPELQNVFLLKGLQRK